MWAEGAARIAAVAPPLARPSVKNPLGSGPPIRAVLFDLDGTLYHQRRMRALMAMELTALVCRRPLQAPRSWRTLAAFRSAQEALRLEEASAGASARQLEIAARQTGLTVDEVDAIVSEWMIERPLKHMPRCRAAGVIELLAFLNNRGVAVGVLSDYPAESKLQALGLAGRFSVVLCAGDPEVGVLKPNPRGFLLASERWQLDPGEVLVVGDRADADAAGAAAAGMPCVIIGRRRPAGSASQSFLLLPSLERLRHVLDDDGR